MRLLVFKSKPIDKLLERHYNEAENWSDLRYNVKQLSMLGGPVVPREDSPKLRIAPIEQNTMTELVANRLLDLLKSGSLRSNGPYS
jgi:hypothetical protein